MSARPGTAPGSHEPDRGWAARRQRRRRGRVERWNALADRFEDAFGAVLLLVLCTFVLMSLAPFHGWSGVAIVAVGSVTTTVSLGSAHVSHPIVIWVSRIALFTVLVAVIAAVTGSKSVLGSGGLLLALMLMFAALAVLRAVVTEEKVGFRTILGALSVYIIVGLLFTFVYAAVDKIQGSPFFGAGVPVHTGDTLFFSMTTLTTTGYGNLVPAGQPGKMLASVEMLMGQIFLVTLIARLVSMWRPGQFLRRGAGIAEPPRGEDVDEDA